MVIAAWLVGLVLALPVLGLGVFFWLVRAGVKRDHYILGRERWRRSEPYERSVVVQFRLHRPTVIRA